jgi:phage terminase small subunit
MIIEDKLDSLADSVNIPNNTHPLLHINSRDAWIRAVLQLIDSGQISSKDKKVIANLADNWEQLLATKYSILN